MLRFMLDTNIYPIRNYRVMPDRAHQFMAKDKL